MKRLTMEAFHKTLLFLYDNQTQVSDLRGCKETEVVIAANEGLKVLVLSKRQSRAKDKSNVSAKQGFFASQTSSFCIVKKSCLHHKEALFVS